MMAQLIDRKQVKTEVRDLLVSAQVSPKGMTALYFGIILALNLADTVAGGLAAGIPATFVSVLTSLMSNVLSIGFILYCMAVRRGQRAEYQTLFDGFSFAGKVILLFLLRAVLTFLWSMLFVIPGIIAAYRYRFSYLNLCENPGISPLEALEMSKVQTAGYKSQLFILDLSYLGWNALATLPALIELYIIYQSLFTAAMTGVFPTTLPTLFPGVPAWLLTVGYSLWALVVSLFYLPHYQCAELAYFDIAKSTSGVGEGAQPPKPTGWSGPDDLGGL